ncbi:MAG: hypothetical protein JST21_13095 [Bacteroidetes bacterium]|nr:hypothetical protein [Bacteroidota bacterium]
MDILLQDVQERLTGQIAALKYVDEDWGQLDDYSPNFPVKWPCALIDCFSATYDNNGNLTQNGLATIRIVYADVKLSNSSAKAPAGQKASSLAFHTNFKAIYKALQGWAGHDHYSRLVRISQRRLTRDDGVRAHEMLFTVNIKDVNAAPEKITVERASFEVEVDTEML